MRGHKDVSQGDNFGINRGRLAKLSALLLRVGRIPGVKQLEIKALTLNKRGYPEAER